MDMLKRDDINQAWKDCLNSTDMADKMEDGLLAATALRAILQSLSQYSQDFARSCAARSSDCDAEPIITSLFERQTETCEALQRDFSRYLKKAERTAWTVGAASPAVEDVH